MLSTQIPPATACIILANRDTSEGKDIELQLLKFTCTGGGDWISTKCSPMKTWLTN